MIQYKKLKDPIYGYISVPDKYMQEIVDTSTFQRLRRIIQTSYAPLYSSAVHNRFVHSLGVFHLGNIACKQLKEEMRKKLNIIPENLDELGNIFLIACLLHDVGHAPFSHTGEEFYLTEHGEYQKLHELLNELVKSEELRKDIVQYSSSRSAAPHEIMSAIIGIKEFGIFLDTMDQKEFFSRCITGYKYGNDDQLSKIKNCFISILNSKVIDVDKLDYLIRDAYITGFETVNIDYKRLLTSLTICYTENSIEIAYYKNAISVLENVVYAHDAERKWIQNHPTVIYEAYILKHIMANLKEQMGEKLFSLNALGKEGESFEKRIKIRLMCDDDIVYLMKNIYTNHYTEEYFERNKRRHPIWKSEAEYKAFLFGIASGGDSLSDVEEAMAETAKYLSGSSTYSSINSKLIKNINKEINDIKNTNLDVQTKQIQIAIKDKMLTFMNFLKSYAKKLSIEFDFVIIRASQFNSGFGKPDFSETKVLFSSGEGEEKKANVGDIVSSLKAKEAARNDFFYLFYKRKEGSDIIIDANDFFGNLINEFILKRIQNSKGVRY